MVDELAPFVVCSLKSPYMTATGVPEHIAQLIAIEENAKAIKANAEAIQLLMESTNLKHTTIMEELQKLPEAIQPAFLQTVIDNFDSRNAMTPAGMREALKELLDEHHRLLRQSYQTTSSNNGATSDNNGGSMVEDNPRTTTHFASFQTWTWEGQLQRGTPLGWKFPKSPVANAWSTWVCGGALVGPNGMF